MTRKKGVALQSEQVRLPEPIENENDDLRTKTGDVVRSFGQKLGGERRNGFPNQKRRDKAHQLASEGEQSGPQKICDDFRRQTVHGRCQGCGGHGRQERKVEEQAEKDEERLADLNEMRFNRGVATASDCHFEQGYAKGIEQESGAKDDANGEVGYPTDDGSSPERVAEIAKADHFLRQVKVHRDKKNGAV